MSRAARYAFILAKAYGVMARSFVGSAYRDLLRLKSLSELSERLFPGERTDTAAAAPVEVEARIRRASIDSMIAVLDYLRDPPPLLVHAARRPEYQTAKALARALAHGGRSEDLRVWDLGKYSAFRIKDARDPEKTLRSSDYSWILPLAQTMPVPELENRLDQHYYERFFALAQALPPADRAPVLRLARTEIALTNVTWALRLRFFFKFDAAKGLPLMIPGTSSAVKAAVSAAFELAADAQEDWRRWRYGWLLSDQLGDAFRAPDPVRAEQKASQFLYQRARHALHQNPFTLGPLLAFFRLKEYEASLLNVAAEAIQLSIPEQEVAAITGAG